MVPGSAETEILFKQVVRMSYERKSQIQRSNARLLYDRLDGFVSTRFSQPLLELGLDPNNGAGLNTWFYKDVFRVVFNSAEIDGYGEGISPFTAEVSRLEGPQVTPKRNPMFRLPKEGSVFLQYVKREIEDYLTRTLPINRTRQDNLDRKSVV